MPQTTHKSSRLLILAPAMAAAALACAAHAQTPAQSGSDAMELEVNRSTRVQLRGAASSIIIANPKVADVTMVDASTLFVTGKGYGTTEVLALDASGRPLLQTQVVVSGNSTGSVRLWRGAQVTDVACGNSCAPSQRPDAGNQ